MARSIDLGDSAYTGQHLGCDRRAQAGVVVTVTYAGLAGASRQRRGQPPVLTELEFLQKGVETVDLLVESFAAEDTQSLTVVINPVDLILGIVIV